MKLTVLGSGGSVPHPLRSSSGYWLETQSGTVLLDCSASVPHRIAQERLDWAGLDAVWISHFHLDHSGGLAAFLHGMRHAPQTRDRKKPLNIFGPAGVRQLIDTFDAASGHRLLKQRFPVEIIEVGDLENFEIVPGIQAVASKTPHTSESLGIHIRDADGRTIVYTSDTGFSDVVAAFAQGVDLLLIECSFVRDKTLENHLELAEAMHVIRKSKPKRAVLTHLFEDWDQVDFAAEVRKFEPPCEVLEAVDGLQIEIP